MTRHRAKPDKAAVADRDERRRALAAKVAETSKLPVDDFRVEMLSWAMLSLDNAKRSLLHGQAIDITPWQKVIDQLTALLPGAGTTLTVKFVEPDAVLSRLSDGELQEFERLNAIARGVTPPTPEPSDERVPGRAEIAAIALGQWVDAHDWSQPLTEAEQIHLRNSLQALGGSHFITRDLWNDIAASPSPPSPASAELPQREAAPAQPSSPTNVVPIKPSPYKSDTDFAPWRDGSQSGLVQGQVPYTPPRPFRCYGDIPDGF